MPEVNFLNASWRADGEDLIAALDEKGYQFVETEEEMMKLESGKSMEMFASRYVSGNGPWGVQEEPSIADMTSKSLNCSHRTRTDSSLWLKAMS
ncbi:MAG: hypothetical protein R2741_03235 [Methanolobus sp.]